MTNEYLAQMFRYNAWANGKTLEACAALPDDVLDEQAAGMEWSLRRTLVHLIGGQDTFLHRLQGAGAPRDEVWDRDPNAWPGFEFLRSALERSNEALVAAAESADVDELVRLPAFRGSPYRAKASFLLLHALEHGIEHRTQINITLRQAGLEPPDLDSWAYAGGMEGLVVQG